MLIVVDNLDRFSDSAVRSFEQVSPYRRYCASFTRASYPPGCKAADWGLGGWSGIDHLAVQCWSRLLGGFVRRSIRGLEKNFEIHDLEVVVGHRGIDSDRRLFIAHMIPFLRQRR